MAARSPRGWSTARNRLVGVEHLGAALVGHCGARRSVPRPLRGIRGRRVLMLPWSAWTTSGVHEPVVEHGGPQLLSGQVGTVGGSR